MKKYTKILKFFITFSLIFSFSMFGLIQYHSHALQSTTDYAGNITISGGKVSAKPGAKIELPITVSNLTNMVSLTFSVFYDDSALELQEFKNNGILSEWEITPAENIKENPYRLSWEDSLVLNPVTDSGLLATLVFEVKKTALAEDYSIDFAIEECYEGYKNKMDMRDFNVLAESGTLTVLENDKPNDPSPEQPIYRIDFSSEKIFKNGDTKIEFTENLNNTSWITVGETGFSITDYIGKTIYVREKTANDTKEIAVNLPLRPAAPWIVELESTTKTSITLKEIPGAQYRISPANSTEVSFEYKDTPNFENLDSALEYWCYARIKATLTSFASDECMGAFSPDKTRFYANVSISGETKINKMLTVDVTNSNFSEFKYQWYRNGEKIISGNADIYFVSKADEGCELYAEVYAASSGFFGSVRSNSLIIEKSIDFENDKQKILHERVIETLKISEKQNSIVLDSDTGTVIHTATLNAIRESGKTLIFYTSRDMDNFSISIAAENITSNAKTTDLKIQVFVVKSGGFISGDLTKTVKSTEKSIVVNPHAKGDFGFEMKVIINNNVLNKLTSIPQKVYYISNDFSINDYCKTDIIDSIGGVSFKISHSSSYVLSNTAPKIEMGSNSTNNINTVYTTNLSTNTNPKTGVDINYVSIIAMAFAFSTLVAGIVCRPFTIKNSKLTKKKG